ncbi:hypothetical protein EW145_g1033 [Phellinidium pouzarii]|uniref:Uncharacterized protein n=1 Tax=Phellinidium pouzarii TaxID=167371 RepID=A0A4S4LLK3_9AGAM|nr:hypothetical protein EW145_g1033 [Phellinidium pouzarii]
MCTPGGQTKRHLKVNVVVGNAAVVDDVGEIGFADTKPAAKAEIKRAIVVVRIVERRVLKKTRWSSDSLRD